MLYTPESPLRRPLTLVHQIFTDIWNNRELIWTLAFRDLKAQNRQALLGHLWLIIPPLANAFIWLLINQQKLILVETEGVPYSIFVFIGTTVWTAFTNCVMTPSDSISNNREVLVKLNVSIEAFVLSGLLKTAINFLIVIAIVTPILLTFGLAFRWTWILFPLAMLFIFSLGFALGLLVSPLGAIYQDIKNSFVPIFAVLMFTAPIVFPLPKKPGFLATIVSWNPLTPLIQFTRDCLLTGNLSHLPDCVMITALAWSFLLVGFMALRVAKPHIIARMGM